jgi:hypothetical protein
MTTCNAMKKLALGVAFSCLVAFQANAIIAYYDNPRGTYGNQGGGNYVLGLEFTVGSTPITVNTLGAFDNGQNGWASQITVAMYQVTLGGQGGIQITSESQIPGAQVTFYGTSGAHL